MRRAVYFLCVCLCAAPAYLPAQDFKVFDRDVQVHGFVTQGFTYTNQNNWLTMQTSGGSGAMTDMGLNMSMPVSDKFRIGAQVYDRNLGQLGQWHPSLDWAYASYKFKPWFAIRGGKVKTTLGLYNDTQDLEFLHTFVLLPQSVYPTDLRDATIAHTGGDVYGDIQLKNHLGTLSYTAYAGHRSDSLYSGYPFLARKFGIDLSSMGGAQYGADLRWATPLKGLLIGASRLNQHIDFKGSMVNPADPTGPLLPFASFSKPEWTNQFYGEYAVGRLRLDSEYRSYFRDYVIRNLASGNVADVRGWYLSGAYRIVKRLEVGSYYSRYAITSVWSGPMAQVFPSQTDTSLPANHIYDKVITGRVDMTRFWSAKVEGHLMNGYGNSTYPNGFYPQVNPNGFKANTNALVLKTGFNF